MPAGLVHFQPLGNKVESQPDRTLLEHARQAGVSIESICNSAGKCGKCVVVVRSGSSHLTPPTSRELAVLSEKGLKVGKRLACQAKVSSPTNIVIEVPEESRRGRHRLLASGVEPRVRLEPAVSKLVLKIPPATLKDLRADDDRLLEILQKKVRSRADLSPGVHGHLPRALREKAWTATVSLYRKSDVVRVEPGDTTSSLYGVAVDIGTTKVVAYLIDLNSGDLISTESMPNPQIPFGEDLMSRISYTMKDRNGGAELQRAVVGGVNDLVRKLCMSRGISVGEILETMVVGNTAMHHIFFGIPAEHVAAAPYAPAVRTSLSMTPGHVGLEMYPLGRVASLPNIAGFVGADAVADLISSGLYKDKNTGMMIDIGTNTEIIAGNSQRLVSCSCASGPAFEGAHIRAGMRASTGAVERVWIDPKTLEVSTRTIDDAPARGICGSGIVDAVAEMFKAGILDSSGKLSSDRGLPGLRRGEGGLTEFVLVRGNRTASGHELTINQHDVQEIQLAKAAIFTGVSILMKKLKINPSDLGTVYAAGAFGTYVDAAGAISIGMYPDVPVERIKFIGNAAGSGARMCLKSTKMRDLADRLSREVEYVELAGERNFQNEFAMAMFLPHRDLSRFPSAGQRHSKGS